MRSILYRFPDLFQFEQMVESLEASEFELGLPAGENVPDGEWVLAIFELGSGRRATSAAARVSVAPDGARLVFELRDWRRLAEYTEMEARRSSPSVTPIPGLTTEDRAAPRKIPAQGSVPPPASEMRPPVPGARVLVVDDDPDISGVVSAMLEAVGLVVTPVGSAEDALELVRRDSFDLLVLDWNLPKMNGLDLCRTLRKEPAFGRVPVLFLTANACAQDMVDALACGADDYVVKPFRAPELGARIFSLLRRKRH